MFVDINDVRFCMCAKFYDYILSVCLLEIIQADITTIYCTSNFHDARHLIMRERERESYV